MVDIENVNDCVWLFLCGGSHFYLFSYRMTSFCFVHVLALALASRALIKSRFILWMNFYYRDRTERATFLDLAMNSARFRIVLFGFIRFHFAYQFQCAYTQQCVISFAFPSQLHRNTLVFFVSEGKSYAARTVFQRRCLQFRYHEMICTASTR